MKSLVARVRGVRWIGAAIIVCSVLSTGAAHSQQLSANVPDGLRAADWSGIRAAYDANRYAARPAAEGYRARNPRQQWDTTFDGRGFTATPDAGGWTWGLELRRYGFSGHERAVERPASVAADGQRVTYDWGGVLEEWYVNDARGLEHGYTVHRRPVGGEPGPLTLDLAIRGGLVADVRNSGRDVDFADGEGRTVLSYSGLTVFDADGRRLPATFEATGGSLLLSIREDAARYPLTIDPIAEQQAYLKASNTDAGDRFGYAVAVSGDTAIVSAYAEDSAATGVNGDQSDNSADGAGAVYVFVRDGSTWSQQAYLKASNAEGALPFMLGDSFGLALDVAGDTVVVGAPLEDSSATGVDGDQSDNSATSAGAAYVFVRNGTTWSQQAYLKASNTDASDSFGWAVAVSGDTIAVGARDESSGATGVNGDQSDNGTSESGAVYVFVRSGTTWSQQAYIKASNTDADDSFGSQVDVDGDTLLVGASAEDSAASGVNGDQSDNSAEFAGAAYVFVRNGTTWSQQAYLKASNPEASDGFGGRIAVSGDTAVIGAVGEDSSATGVNGDQSDNAAIDSGAAYVFTWDGMSWSQQAYVKASNTEAFDRFSESLAIWGDTLAVCATFEDSAATGVDGDQSDNSAIAAGAAYLFTRSGTSWTQQAYLKASNTEAGDGFGSSVGLSGGVLVVTARDEDSGASGVNGDQGDESAPLAGAAYAFDLELPECFLVFGSGPGSSPFGAISHTWATQLSGIFDFYAVTMEDNPSFPIMPGFEVIPTARHSSLEPDGSSIALWQGQLGGPGVAVKWAEFTAQVLMWNPDVFPGNPEQFSDGLAVTIWSDGALTALPYGTSDGMNLWLETYTGHDGYEYMKFPFDIEGL